MKLLRRKMFAYAVVFITGLVSAYIVLECHKIFLGAGISVAVSCGVIKVDLEYIPEKEHSEKIKLIMFILIGFICFFVSYMKMNGDIRMLNNCNTSNKCNICDITNIKGTVCEINRKSDYYRLTIKPTNIQCSGKIEANYYKEFPTDYYNMIGTSVILYGSLKEPSGQENPGCFNYKTYMYSKGIRFIFSTEYLVVEDINCPSLIKYRRSIYRIRENFLACFDEIVGGFIRGVIFGDKSEIDKETIEAFNDNSTGHILAVSGLHIGFLFSLLRIVTGKRRTWPVTVLIIIVIFIYGEMTGWSPSTLRAILVLSLNISAIHAGRTSDLLTSVSAAAMIILLINPYQIVNAGFQLSFVALLGICFLSEPLSHYIGETLSVLVAVQIMVAPLIVYYYSSFNITSMFINIPIVFLSSLLVPVTIISLSVFIINGILPDVLITIISNLSIIIIKLNNIFSFNKYFRNDMSGINTGLVVLFYLMVLFMSSEWTRVKLIRRQGKLIKRLIPYILIPAVLICISTYNPYLNDEVVFIAIGQGDSIHIRGGNKNVLIDGGGSKDYDVGEKVLKPYLLHNNVMHIDAAALTHLHVDHCQGVFDLSRVFPVGKVIIPFMYEKSIKSEKNAICCDVICINTGEKIIINNNMYIETIWPVNNKYISCSAEDENENNMVYVIHIDDIKIMVTGDLLERDELDMIKYYKGRDTLKCDVLKIGHHGSKTSSSEQFLDEVDPEIAVIQVGRNNSYGHPHQQTIDRLEERNIKIFRTDIDGAVGLDIDGNNIHVDTMN